MCLSHSLILSPMVPLGEVPVGAGPQPGFAGNAVSFGTETRTASALQAGEVSRPSPNPIQRSSTSSGSARESGFSVVVVTHPCDRHVAAGESGKPTVASIGGRAGLAGDDGAPGQTGGCIAAGAVRGHERQHPIELVDGGRRLRFLDLYLETLERPSMLIENRAHRTQAGPITAIRQR